MKFHKIRIPSGAEAITTAPGGGLKVPDCPIIPYIEGDGIGGDITRAAMNVWNAAVRDAYGAARRIAWMEVYAGEKALDVYGEDAWLPEETVEALRRFRVAVKGPLTTPIGGGIRSLNVALRRRLDLYVCQRPVRHFTGVPSPVRHPERTDMVVFRENTEDIYAGIEWAAGSAGAAELLAFLRDRMGVGDAIRFPESTAFGIKPISREGSLRLIRSALRYAVENDRDSVTFVHKGNIMKFTEGAFRDWGYACAREEFGAEALDGGPWHAFANPKTGRRIVVKDVITDAFLQQILTRPGEYDVIATMNLNGDYISDALAACVGGIGMAPGGNINDEDGVALFEATHGTAPKYAGQDKVNPGSLILSGEMLLRYIGWNEAADRILAAMDRVLGAKIMTYDLARLREGAQEVSCSGFGKALSEAIREAGSKK